MASAIWCSIRSKLGRGGVQELRTRGPRTQNDQFGFGYRSRLKTIIWLAVLMRNPSSQLASFADKRRVYEHFGQKAVTQRICAGARFSRPCARTGTPHRIAAICGDLLVRRHGRRITQNSAPAQPARLRQLAFAPVRTWPDTH